MISGSLFALVPRWQAKDTSMLAEYRIETEKNGRKTPQRPPQMSLGWPSPLYTER